MKYTTTDGREWLVPDMCAHCQMDTGGNHETQCPLHQAFLLTHLTTGLLINEIITDDPFSEFEVKGEEK